VVEILANPEFAIDTKADFSEEANLRKVAEALKPLGLQTELSFDEEHSVWTVGYHDSTNATRWFGTEIAGQPEYRRLRILSKQTARRNEAPFAVIKDNYRQVLGSGRELLAYLKSEGTRDCNVQRYKGLGEMNAEQLWETTMNAEKRTLLRVMLEDLVECEQIFSTLMGEDVENRRKFIEDNALDVRNLDV
jgi:DNA gyrase subunit B